VIHISPHVTHEVSVEVQHTARRTTRAANHGPDCCVSSDNATMTEVDGAHEASRDGVQPVLHRWLHHR
jgi:hypothetical protein